MEAFNTDDISKKKGRAPSTERAFLGRQYERWAATLCRRRGLRIVTRNHHWRGGEIDIIATDRKGRWVVVEVRGVRRDDFRPSLCLSPAKRRRLMTYAARLGTAVSVELWEFRGNPPATWLARWIAALKPEWFGITWRTYRVS